MNPQDPLAALKPLREPPAIDWWPLAPGWWLLLVLCLGAIGVLTYLWFRARQRTAYRRQALQRLAMLQAEHARDQDHSEFLSQVNALLKRVALIAFPGREVARLHGDRWLDFLNRSASQQPPFSAALVTAHYSGNADAETARQAYRCATHWLKHHGGTP